MRKGYVFLTVLLSLGGQGTSSPGAQDCCHRSPAKSTAAPTAKSWAAMAPFDTEDVRKGFNAWSEKVRVVALLSPTYTRLLK